ncbi:LRR receptor-like serine/threonine-protein kinase FLS2 [Vigna unguiculata]|uniref:LRR receptor-like serine/threonine-protein kinase FLS2 n=1 Tax=Vigna unguiculata TaxID=3917 RepID=A0A4D6M3V4_VIGUN|nr:LRR receptor-like serine/threonine-protein kinase FLS2 [Vigna unguiculata]
MRCIPEEREALLQFKAAIVDDFGMLSSWTTPHCCQWEGIRRSMSGEIHKSLVELSQLQYLNLSKNSFIYTHIPEFLGSLRNLKYLDLSSCRFQGQIPSQFGSLSHLKYLNLAHNAMNGLIPHQFGNLSQLRYLDLSYNYFEGNIPSQLGNLSQLHELYFGGGYLDNLKISDGGQWLSNLLSLTHLSLDFVSNLNRSHTWLQVIVKLPKLRELSLFHCSLSDNFILSSRTSKFNSSTSLSVLHLSQNSFTSPMVFQWVSNITSNLVELDLGYSLLEGSTSSQFNMVMNSLRHLDLSSNNFKAKDLKSFTNICTLCSLYLSSNKFTEDLPSILGNLSSGCVRHSLHELDLSSNDITGTLSDISVFSSLKTLFLDANRFNGMIHEGVKLPSTLENLSISRNFFQGGIPKLFGNACALHSLDMSYNSFSDELSMIISHLSGCARYSLEELSLQSIIPTSMGLLLDLQALLLRNNNLVEGIPFSLSNCTKLVMLDM